MCGIAGFLDNTPTRSESTLAAEIEVIASAMTHRGPDAKGRWIDERCGVALGHRRLSILDLSGNAAQPMRSADGRYVCVFNGEIFNFLELRAELEAAGHRFRSRSDTEVLLASCAQWGIEEAVRRFVGMFAIGIWDCDERRLVLVRDRLGVKPLYWGRYGGRLFFASELDALRRDRHWSPRLNTAVLGNYLRYGYVPGPESIYEGVFKLPPGHILSCRAGTEPEIEAYWRLEEAARAASWRGSDAEAVEAFDSLAQDTVRRRLVSAVPVGAFLSGGVDSAFVVATASAASPAPLRTFTVGFSDPRYDESERARVVARSLGAEHTELRVEAGDLVDLVPEAITIHDEPFADYSQIPTLLLCRAARRHVTVALSGDGGDELLAGYATYPRTLADARRLRFLPAGSSRAAGALCRMAGQPLAAAVDGLLHRDLAGARCERLARICAARGEREIFQVLSSLWQDPSAALAAGRDGDAAPDRSRWAPELPALRAMQLADFRRYLPDDILTKVDRASMAASLEVRTPLLDHRLVELVWRFPDHLKLRAGRSKWLLRQALARHLPARLHDAPKRGFTPPIGEWLRVELRDWAEALLDPARLRREGRFDAATIGALWRQHRDGKANWERQLWTILAFEAWLGKWRAPGTDRPDTDRIAGAADAAA